MATQYRNFTDITVSRGIGCHNGMVWLPTHESIARTTRAVSRVKLNPLIDEMGP